MKLQHRASVPASIEWLWDFVTDIPKVAGCMPWVTDIREVSENQYKATVKIRVGPISLKMDGNLVVEELRPEEWRGTLRAEAADRRAAGRMYMKMDMRLEPKGDNITDLVVDTDANIAGKLGEFGQPILRRVADSMMQQFTKNVAKQASQDSG